LEIVRYKATVEEIFSAINTEESIFNHNEGHGQDMLPNALIHTPALYI
jgi:hypothetical protein